MKCKHCGKEIMLLSKSGPWVHAEDYAVECHKVTEAAPEKEDE